MGTYLATAEKLNANSNCQQILVIEKRKRKSKHEEKYMIIATLLIMLVSLIEEHAE